MSNEAPFIPSRRTAQESKSVVSPAPDPAKPDKKDELRLLINSRHPLITVETSEEERVEQLLREVAAELGIAFYTWSVTSGLAQAGGAPLYNTQNPEQALANIALLDGDGIFLLKDFLRYCEQDRICRRVRDLAEKFRTVRRSIVISGPSLHLPPELEGDSVAFQFALPNADELAPAVARALAELSRQEKIPVTLDRAETERVALNLLGLPMEEALRILRMSALTLRRADASLPDAILEAKRQALRVDGLIEIVPRDATFHEVAGLQHLRDWIAKRKSAMTPEGRQFGLEPPKGVLITGVQGCGKSLAARAVAGEWSFELARLDPGALYDKYVGESERRLRKALDLAQQLAPVVLWIDEMEKGFASAGASSDADAGLSQRLLGTMLTWMQDRESGVFLAATSNDVSALPPEMLRKGRFDEIFFVDLPSGAVRADLFALQLQRRGRDAREFDLGKLASASEGFSGAEIEQAIVSGLYTAFAAKVPLSTEILLGELHATKPLSVMRAEEIQSLRDWAKTRAVPAD